MPSRSFIAVIVAALLAAIPATAHAAPASKAPTQTYDLSFTLPTVGISGCMVCHGDSNLVVAGKTSVRSVFVDPEAMARTAHAATLCTGCHTSFAYKTPHKNTDTDQWRMDAKGACKGCHAQQFADVTNGAHSGALKPGESPDEVAAERAAAGKPTDVPLCGDCHGSHEISYIDAERWETTGTAEIRAAAIAGSKALHGKGIEMCGGCHEAETDTYADYYHGAAYRRGAPDAPSCWDCHGAHEMLPSSDRRSPVHPQNLVETCGQCHKNANEKYAEYAKFIHGRAEVEKDVFLIGVVNSTRDVIKGAISTIASWFTGTV